MTEFTKEREDVWFEFSQLFLDMGLNQDDLFCIARNVSQTSFSIEELTAIMEDEVAPVLDSNLLVVGGEWCSFDRQKEVVEPIKQRLARIPSVCKNGWLPLAYLRRKWCMMNVGHDWSAILGHIQKIRSSTTSGA